MNNNNIDFTFLRLLDIDDVIRILSQKKELKEFIFFEKTLPIIDSDLTIRILKGDGEAFGTYFTYFHTYGILHEILQIFNKIGTDLMKHFCRKILEKPEMDINTLKTIISKKYIIPDKKILVYNFGHNNFFINNKQKYNKGSDIKNNTACYNNNIISMKLLEMFLLKEVYHDTVFLIKFPSIISISVIDSLKLLSNIFKKTIVFKLMDDSFFKDSFHVLCSELNINNYNKIKKEIKSYLETNKIKNLESINLKSIIKMRISDDYKYFENSLKEFGKCIQTLVSTYLIELFINLSRDIENASRNDKKWENLDNYYNNKYI